jgi:hypothetical protein
VGERKDGYRVLVENVKERNHLEDLGVDRRIILVRRVAWTGLIWLRTQ